MLEIYDQRTAALIIIRAFAFLYVGFVSAAAGAAFVCSESSELVAAGIARRDFSPVPISPVVDDNERGCFLY
jgi:hypothetical protein